MYIYIYGFSESYRRVCKRAVYFNRRVLYLCHKNMHLKNKRTFEKTCPMCRKRASDDVPMPMVSEEPCLPAALASEKELKQLVVDTNSHDVNVPYVS